MNRVVLFLVMLFAATPLLAAGDQLTKPLIHSDQSESDQEFFEKYAWLISGWNREPSELRNHQQLEFWRGYVKRSPLLEELTNKYSLHQLDSKQTPPSYVEVSDSTINKALLALAEEATKRERIRSGLVRYNGHDYFWYFTSPHDITTLDHIQIINGITIMFVRHLSEDYGAFPEGGFYAFLLPQMTDQVVSVSFSSGGDALDWFEIKDERAQKPLFSSIIR